MFAVTPTQNLIFLLPRLYRGVLAGCLLGTSACGMDVEEEDLASASAALHSPSDCRAGTGTCEIRYEARNGLFTTEEQACEKQGAGVFPFISVVARNLYFTTCKLRRRSGDLIVTVGRFCVPRGAQTFAPVWRQSVPGDCPQNAGLVVQCNDSLPDAIRMFRDGGPLARARREYGDYVGLMPEFYQRCGCEQLDYFFRNDPKKQLDYLRSLGFTHLQEHNVVGWYTEYCGALTS